MTIRPGPVGRGGSLLALAMGGLFLFGPLRDVILRHEAPGVIDLIAGLAFVAVGAINWSSYIRVDDTSVMFGGVLNRRRCDRQAIARITFNAFPGNLSTRFIRRDGSVGLATSGFLYSRSGLKSLADYLGVPFVE